MRLLRRLQLGATVIAAGTLVAAYALRSHWQWTAVFIACALWFWYGRRLTWTAAPTVSVAAFIMGAVVGVWLGIQPLYMLLVVTAALSVWDLDGLERRIGSAAGETRAALVHAHLAKLGATIVAGLITAGIALTVELRLDFGWVCALSLLLVVSLSRALHLLRNGRSGDESRDG